MKLAKQNNLIPVYREILADLETPVSLFLKTGDKPYSYLLESVEGGERAARYSFIGGKPSLVFSSRGKQISIEPAEGDKKIFTTQKDPLWELENILKRYRQASVPGLPLFSGGAVGYMGYDMVRFIEKIPDKNKQAFEMPEALFVFTDSVFIFDHLNKKIKVVVNVLLDPLKEAESVYEQAAEKIETEIENIESTARRLQTYSEDNFIKDHKIESNFSKRTFEKAVLKAKSYIKKGDIFQVVLSQVFHTPVRSNAFDVYRALRSVNPSPYMFYLNFKNFKIAGSSPEVHVRCEKGRAILRPIAGTRKRGRDEHEDQKLEKELLKDPKERAEHLMLVDLGRNDLGRVCEYKSVRVPEFMVVERYSHVMHLVSLVEGRLKPKKTIFDLLRATFPAGTISGAPKVRAMEIIDELENQKRGFYSGVVGYFSYSGNLDSCIAIRSIIIKDDTAYVQAGAGIVTDSKPEKEYEETVNKAKALFKAIELAEKGISS